MKKEFEIIMVPVDGSNIAKKAAKKAIFLAKSTGIKVVAMHVVDMPYLPAFYECSDENNRNI